MSDLASLDSSPPWNHYVFHAARLRTLSEDIVRKLDDLAHDRTPDHTMTEVTVPVGVLRKASNEIIGVRRALTDLLTSTTADEIRKQKVEIEMLRRALDIARRSQEAHDPMKCEAEKVRLRALVAQYEAMGESVRCPAGICVRPVGHKGPHSDVRQGSDR
jgi:hypothetical protein